MSDSPLRSLALVHGRVLIREPRPDDREPIVSLADDDRLFSHMMIRFDRAQMDTWFTAWLEEVAAASRSYWPLIIEVDGSAVGFVMLSRSSDQVAELQWYVTPVSWGRGYATDATHAVLAFVFSDLGVHRLFATADPANEASVRVLERTGFHREGHMIDYVLTHNGWMDRFMYALLADDRVPSAPRAGRTRA